MNDEYEKALAEQRLRHPELFEDVGDEKDDFYTVPDEKAEIVEVAGNLAWLRFRSDRTGQINGKADLGEEDPRSIEDVRQWAEKWNSSGVARWPDGWILRPPSKPITAQAQYQDAKGYGPTLSVLIQVDAANWRIYSKSKDKLLEALAKLAPDAPAVIPLGGGYRYQCFGSTLSVFEPADGGLFKQAKVAEHASVALYGEMIEPA